MAMSGAFIRYAMATVYYYIEAPDWAADACRVGDNLAHYIIFAQHVVQICKFFRMMSVTASDPGVFHHEGTAQQAGAALLHQNRGNFNMVNFKAGDKVELLSGGEIFPLMGFENGQKYEIAALPGDAGYGDSHHARNGLIKIVGGDCYRGTGFAKPEQLRQVVEFPNGSRVRVVKGGDEYPLHGFKNGQEYEVIAQPGEYPNGGHSRAGRIQIAKSSDSIHRGYALPKQLEIVEDIAPEPKVGDRVRVLAHTHAGYEGTVTAVRPEGYICADRGLLVKLDGGAEVWRFIENVEIIEAAAEKPQPKFSAGEKVRSKKFGYIYVLKDRNPEMDDRGHGIAWNCIDGGWIGEDQVEKIEQPAPSADLGLYAQPLQIGDRVVLTHNGYRPGAVGTIEKIEGGFLFMRPDVRSLANRGDGLIAEFASNMVKIAE